MLGFLVPDEVEHFAVTASENDMVGSNILPSDR
jgi:hypothetical protein